MRNEENGLRMESESTTASSNSGINIKILMVVMACHGHAMAEVSKLVDRRRCTIRKRFHSNSHIGTGT